MKIVIDGVITTDVGPDSAKFFYVTTEEIVAAGTLKRQLAEMDGAKRPILL